MAQHHQLTVARGQVTEMEMGRGLVTLSVDTFVEDEFGLVVQS
jgi:hypothetical protein